MFISTSLSDAEFAALQAAAVRCGFADLESFVYWALMQQVAAVLADPVDEVALSGG